MTIRKALVLLLYILFLLVPFFMLALVQGTRFGYPYPGRQYASWSETMVDRFLRISDDMVKGHRLDDQQVAAMVASPTGPPPW